MNYQVTGNEYVSLPTIREKDGAAEGLTFLYMTLKGMLEVRGRDGLIRPYLMLDGRRQTLAPVWERAHGWVPSMTAQCGRVRFRCVYLTPMGERAFALRLEAENEGDALVLVRLGTDGEWEKTLHEINETAELTQGREAAPSGWNHMFVFSQKPATPLFALAPCVGDNQPFSEFEQGAQWTLNGFSYDIYKDATLAPGERAVLDVFFGVGYESVAAATSAKELLRQGFDRLLERTENWLSQREKHLADQRLQTLLNTNLFFAFFYASGRAVDTEELCMMTSRSPRYYVSAAYWDRDSLLWAFPAILSVDAGYARELLLYVFTKQARNFGTHSRYIDGTVLEPGFELDELCAPVIALWRYVKQTGDAALAGEQAVQNGLLRILAALDEKKHGQIDLYETFLQPTDDLRRYPYLTYDNTLVVCALSAMAQLLDRDDLAKRAQKTRAAILDFCVREQNGRRVFVWSTDLNGHFDIYDEPPGSLQLLPFYGLCAESDEVWQNTVRMIRDKEYALSFAHCPIAEIGCRHAPHPWGLSICNSLLSGHKESALKHLSLTMMDNGVACESVNEYSGNCETGEAFATCAGFLAYALTRALT